MSYLSLSLSVAAAALGVVALVIAMQHLRELKTTHDETHTLRRETLQALGLHEILVQDPRLLDAVREIGSAYAIINEANDPFFQTLARRELTLARQRLQSISGGRLTVSEEEITGLITFAALVLDFAERGDEFCTSALAPPSFWRTETGYLEQNRELCHNGITIRRTFIFDDEADFADPDAQWEMTRQMQAGIDVSYSIRPRFEPRDIILLKKPGPDGILAAVYAGEITLRRNKTIANIDIWSADNNPEKVLNLSRTLEMMLNSSQLFAPKVATSSLDDNSRPSHTAGTPVRREASGQQSSRGSDNSQGEAAIIETGGQTSSR
jgi:hypothetical protein